MNPKHKSAHRSARPLRLGLFTSLTLALLASLTMALAAPVSAQVVPDMVSRTALRVCADPANLPFSNKKKEGFENKIASIVADQLKEPVRYFWAPSGPGFVRNTLSSDMCDVVMGYTVGAEMVQSTNPYYRSTYTIVVPKGSDLAGIETIVDPKLKGKKIGVFAATPPVDVMLKQGLLSDAKLYPLIVDHRFDSPLNSVLDDLKAKRIDAAIVWGPLIGQSVKASDGALVLSPLLRDAERPGFSYRISFGVRHDEPDWKHKLEGVIRARRADIKKVLDDYGVPLLDNNGKLIPPGPAAETSLQPVPQVDRGKQAPAGFKMPGPAPVNGSTGQ